MPSGITHDRITLWTLPWIAGIGYGITHNGELTLILAGGFLFSGLMFGPDLDIHSIQYKRWGVFKKSGCHIAAFFAIVLCFPMAQFWELSFEFYIFFY